MDKKFITCNLVKVERMDGWIENPGKKNNDQERGNLLPLKYLVLDEVSMTITTEVFEATSAVAGFLKNHTCDPTETFGGINVILVGDFHQFPPPRHEHLMLFNRKQPTNVN